VIGWNAIHPNCGSVPALIDRHIFHNGLFFAIGLRFWKVARTCRFLQHNLSEGGIWFLR